MPNAYGGGATGVTKIMPGPSGDTTGAKDAAAYTSAVSSLIGVGGILIFQPGRYYIAQLLGYTGVEYWGSPGAPVAGPPGTIITAPQGSALDMWVPSQAGIVVPALRFLSFDGGNGANSAVLVQANQFNGVNINAQVSRMVIQDVNFINIPGDGILSNSASTGGSFFTNVRAFNPYGNGINLQGSDHHIHNAEVYTSGLNGYLFAGVASQATNIKSNFAGKRGVAGSTNGVSVTGGANCIGGGCFLQNDVGSGLNGNSLYVSGSRNRIDVAASGASNALLYLDVSAVYNSIDLQCNNQQNQTNPAFVYQINNAGVKNNKVRITGNPTVLTSYATLTNGGTEQNNEFTCDGELYGTQNVAFAASITPDVYQGSNVQVGTLTGAITINNPVNGHAGSRIVFRLLQDATGGRVVTFGANYKTAAAIPTTLSTATQIMFVLDGGGLWREVARATA